MAEKAKMMTVRGILPPDTPSSLHLALRGVSSYENFKRVLRLTLQFLSDHGGVSGRNRSANVMDEAPEAESRNGIAVGRGVAVGRDQEAIEAGDSGEGVGPGIPALMASMQEAGLPSDLIRSAVQNYQRRGARRGRNRQS